ncbi:hypothetical protein, partial [Algoriphagus sp.]|uniref:hypothetical protein n=1 Tax=Algoriphagus sp. TaxID=1872435 RepID=UPI002719AF27
ILDLHLNFNLPILSLSFLECTEVRASLFDRFCHASESRKGDAFQQRLFFKRSNPYIFAIFAPLR